MRRTRCYALMMTPVAIGAGPFQPRDATPTSASTSSSAQIASELDQTKRNAMIAEAFKIHSDDIGHIPLHQQALAWAMKKNIDAGAACRQLQLAQMGRRQVTHPSKSKTRRVAAIGNGCVIPAQAGIQCCWIGARRPTDSRFARERRLRETGYAA